MNLFMKLKELGGDKLVENFSNSFLLGEGIVFIVKTDRGVEIVLSPERLRKIIAGGIPYFHPKHGWIKEKECAEALLEWRIKRLDGPTAMHSWSYYKNALATDKNKSK